MGLGEAAFKKVLRTREHRERAQPAARARLGLLEKHKDYVLRARDHHRKRDTLKALRIRAANRNPDEFHFGMIKSRLIGGKHLSNWTERNKSLPADMLKLMKTQDVSYIELQKMANKKKLEREAEELALLEATQSAHQSDHHPIRQHVFFAEDDEEVQQLISTRARKSMPSTSSVSATEESVTGMGSPPSEEDELDELVRGEMVNPVEKALRSKRALVAARQKRIYQLERLEHKMRLDTQLLAKGRRRKIGTDEYGFAKYKWAPERKK